MSKQQSSQLSALQSLFETESSEAMKRIETDYKEDNEKGSIASISKEDMQRERRTWIVTRGVTEKRKLQEIYNERKQELEQGHKTVKDELKIKFTNDREELKSDYEHRNKEIELKLFDTDNRNLD